MAERPRSFTLANIDTGWCLDNTQGTPCCGYGECNIFCYNCDGGCRTENLAGCLNIAAQVEDFCLEDIDCEGNPAECTTLGEQCGTAFTQDKQQCAINYSSKRSLQGAENSAELDARAVKDNQTAFDIATLFQIVDINKDNSMDLSEYLRLVNITTNGSLHGPMTTSKWVNYFYS